jgi:putative hydrolase of HD superfamily
MNRTGQVYDANREYEWHRLEEQIQFILEIDKLKQVLRNTYLLDGSRKENGAEHSWHTAVMAILLAEHAAGPDIDLLHVLKMLLIHDLVEIDAGDTFRYDDEGNKSKARREQGAADRIFNILPPDQAKEIRSLWDEFEARQTPEARFAAAIDRLQPQLHNYHTQGRTWREHGITVDRVIAKNEHMSDGSEVLWRYAKTMILDAVEKGYLAARDDRSESRQPAAAAMQPFDSMAHEEFMARALLEAEVALRRGDRPIGTVIAHNGKIIASASNTFATDKSHIAHSELKAIQACASYLYHHGTECIIYTTVEPCVMCLGAIVMANIRHIVFGMPDRYIGARSVMQHNEHIGQRVHNYLGGVLEDRCIEVYRRHSEEEAEQCLRGTPQ